nr:hypothetical protein [Gluconobacter kondonii]
MNIHVVKGRTSDQTTTLQQAIHDAMLEAFSVPERDRYQMEGSKNP